MCSCVALPLLPLYSAAARVLPTSTPLPRALLGCLQVEVLTQQITKMFRKCEHRLQQFGTEPSPSAADEKVKRNVQVGWRRGGLGSGWLIRECKGTTYRQCWMAVQAGACAVL